jgi:hypothetical protein
VAVEINKDLFPSKMLIKILDILLVYWPLTFFLASITYLVHNKYYHGLNKYPGPWLAAYTDWWRFFDAYSRKAEKTHIALHRRYGDIVRVGPNTLSFADPRALKTIYGLNKGFSKVSRCSIN